MVYVSNLPGNLFEEWPSINEDNFEEMLSGYDPSEWPSIEAYFDGWEWESMLTPEPAQETVHTDTSVTQHPKVNCVVENLKAFLGGTLIPGNNIKVTALSSLGVDGQTTPPTGGSGE